MQILTNNKTTGWIGSAYFSLCKFIPCTFRNMDQYVAEKNYNSINVETHASKMCKIYLLLCNLDVPDNIKDKGEVIKNTC